MKMFIQGYLQSLTKEEFDSIKSCEFSYFLKLEDINVNTTLLVLILLFYH